MIWENMQSLCVVALEELVHGGHPGRRSGSGGCVSGWNCVVATVLDCNVENKKIKIKYRQVFPVLPNCGCSKPSKFTMRYMHDALSRMEFNLC